MAAEGAAHPSQQLCRMEHDLVKPWRVQAFVLGFDDPVPLADDVLKRVLLPTCACKLLSALVLIIPPGHVLRARVGHARAHYGNLAVASVVGRSRSMLRAIHRAADRQHPAEATRIRGGGSEPPTFLSVSIGDERGATLVTDRPEARPLQDRRRFRRPVTEGKVRGVAEASFQGRIHEGLGHVQGRRLQFRVVLERKLRGFIGESRYFQQVLLDQVRQPLPH